MSTKVILPTGRLVSGWPNGSKIDPETKELFKNKKTGETYTKYSARVAIKKTPGVSNFAQEVWGKKIYDIAVSEAPNHYNRSNFAWKVEDGDSTRVDMTGAPVNQREGFAGHWIVKAEGRYAPIYGMFIDGIATQVNAIEAGIALGDYVQMSILVSAQTEGAIPSLMAFPSVIVLNHKGEPIQGKETFNSNDFQQGANTSVSQARPRAEQKPPPVPKPEFLQVPTAPFHTLVMTPKAGGLKYEDFLANGWTDKQIINEGYGCLTSDEIPF